MNYLTRLAAVALAGVPAAHAADYFPLIEGSYWEYVGIGGSAETATVVESTLIFDIETPTVEYGPSDANLGLNQFWDCEDNGDVILRGYYREVEGFGLVYEPGIESVNTPLFVGKTWISGVDVFSYPELEPAGSLILEFEVVSEEIVTVPAGEFPAFGIGVTILGGDPHPLYGVAGLVAGVDASDWWTESIGRVQYVANDTYQLAAFDFPSTPSEPTSWTQVKALFQP